MANQMNQIIGLTASVLVGVTTIASRQPMLMTIGAAVSSVASTAVLMAGQKKKQIDEIVERFEQTIILDRQAIQIELAKTIALDRQAIQSQLAQTITLDRQAIQIELAGFNQDLQAVTGSTAEAVKKVNYISTSNRLVLAKLQDIQKQQRVISGTSTEHQQQLERLQSSPVNHQSPSSPKKSSPISLTSRRPAMTHIYIDGNNFVPMIKNMGLEINWEALKSELIELGQGTATDPIKYYTGVHAQPSSGQKQWYNHLEDLNYEIVPFPLYKQSNGKWKTIGDDMAIGVNLMDDVKPGDRVILVTGDGDFIPLVERLITRRAKVMVVGASSNTSRRLQDLLGQDFISLESISDKITKFRQLKIA